MPDPLQALLAGSGLPAVTFPPTSRYADVGITAYLPTPAPGIEAVPIAYLRRRLVPRPERFAPLQEYRTVDADRRDLVAAAHLADAALWWRLADANGVIDPAAMTVPAGQVLRITLPVDVPGGRNG